MTARVLPVHMAALSLLLLAVWPILDLDGVFISDEGSYRLQVAALEEGSWDMGYAFSEADPQGAFVPFHAASYSNGVLVPYAEHPAWPRAQHLAVEVVGEELGLRLLGVLSLLGLAVAAWYIGGDLGGRGASVWAFWLAAASPALANTWLLWAHTPSALLGALLVLGALRVDGARWWIAIAATAAAGGVLLRAEGFLWAGSVAVALLILGGSRRARVCSLAVSVSAVAALGLERLWTARILDGPVLGGVAPRGAGATLAERLSGARIALLDGSVVSRPAGAMGLAIVVVMGASVVAFSRRRPDVGVGLLALTTLLFAARLAIESEDPAPGLVAAAPLLLMTVGWRPPHVVRWVAGAMGLHAIAVAVTVYPDGGALQWGGRFFSPMLGPLAGAAGAFFASHHAKVSPPPAGLRRLEALVVVSALIVQAVGALVVPKRLRPLSEDGVDRVVGLGQRVIVAGGTQVARLDWRGWPDRCWIAVPEGGGVDDVQMVIETLARSGISRASYAGIDPDLLRAAGVAIDEDPAGRPIGVLTIDQAGSPSIAPPYRCDG